MSNVAEIIAWADRKYPNQEVSANKIIDLNDIHKEIYIKIQRLKNEYEIAVDETVGGQLIYELPSDCVLEDIIHLKVSKEVYVEGETIEWDTYYLAGLQDSVTKGNYYSRVTKTIYALSKNGEPLEDSGHRIQIFYYKTPTELTALGDTPDLEPNYHQLLKLKLTQTLASQGANPDADIANYWEDEYKELYSWIERDLNIRNNTAPNTQANTVDWTSDMAGEGEWFNG